MLSKLKFTALLLGFVFLIWVAVGVAWYGRSYVPSHSELLQGLIAVPLLLLAGYALLQRVLSSVFNPAAGPVPEDLQQNPQQKAATPPPAKARQLLVLGGCIKVPVGDAQDLLEACAEGVRPELDGELRDEKGFPVLAARVAELDAVDVQEWWSGLNLEAAFAQGSAWVAQLPAARARELRLLAEVLADSAAELERKVLLAVEQLAADTGSDKALFELQLPLVHVRLELPQAWTQDDLNALLTWSRLWLARAAPALEFDVQTFSPQPTNSAENSPVLYLWSEILLAAKQAQRAAQEDVWLLASAHSAISQEEVDRLAVTGGLYGPKRRDGRIAGEGAAAMALLSIPADAKSAVWGAELPFPVIASATVLPSTAAGKLAAQAVAPILEHCQVPANKIGFVATNADHRSASAIAAANLLTQQFPELSLEKDCTMLGVPCGNTARVSALASLLVAADFVAEQQSAALAVELTSESWHTALLMPRAWLAASNADAPQNS